MRERTDEWLRGRRRLAKEVDNEPNRFCVEGYVHEEKKDGTPCGHLYTGDLYGYLLIYRGALPDA